MHVKVTDPTPEDMVLLRQWAAAGGVENASYTIPGPIMRLTKAGYLKEIAIGPGYQAYKVTLAGFKRMDLDTLSAARQRIAELEAMLRAVRGAEWGYGMWPTLDEINAVLDEPDWGKTP